jgi:hypothetical protein
MNQRGTPGPGSLTPQNAATAKRDDGDYGIGDPILTNRHTFLLDNLNGTCAIVFYWTLDDAHYTNV